MFGLFCRDLVPTHFTHIVPDIITVESYHIKVDKVYLIVTVPGIHVGLLSNHVDIPRTVYGNKTRQKHNEGVCLFQSI